MTNGKNRKDKGIHKMQEIILVLESKVTDK